MILAAFSAPSAPPWPVDWAPLFSAIGVLVIGAITASIAYRQWQTARSKLRLDLYDRRLVVYRGCLDAVAGLARSGQLTGQELNAFSAALGEVDFLFDQKVRIFVDRLHALAWEAGLPAAADDDAVIGAATLQWREQSLVWLNAQGKMLKDVFAPYMQLEGSRPRRLRGPPTPTPPPTRPLERSPTETRS